MKNSLFLIWIALLFSQILSCVTADTVSRNESVQVCTVSNLKEKYFADWQESIVCAQNIMNNSKDIANRQIASYVLGEYYFLAGDSEVSFSYFSNSISGPDSGISLASLNYIVKLRLTFDKINEIPYLSVRRTENNFVKYLVENEKRNWAFILDDTSIFNEITSRMNILSKAVIKKENSSDEVKVSVSSPSDTMDFYDYVDNPDGLYSVEYNFSLSADAILPLFVQTDSDAKILLDGMEIKAKNGSDNTHDFYVVRNFGEYKFTKGDHLIVMKFQTDDNDSAKFKVSLPSEAIKISYNLTGIKGSALRYEDEKAKTDDAFDELVFFNGADLSGTTPDIADFIRFFSNVTGKMNPPVLYTSAGIFYKNNQPEEGTALLKKAVKSNPKLVKPAVMLMEKTIESASPDNIMEIVHEFSFDEKFIDYELLLSDILSFTGQPVIGLKHSEDTLKKYAQFYAAHFYYALALEENGNFRKAASVRLSLLKKLPNNYSLMESVLELAEKMNDLRLQRKMIKMMLKLTPDSRKLETKLAQNMFISGDIANSGKLFLRILEKHPGDVDALVGMGDLETLKGNKWSAAEFYRKATQLDPENDAIYKKYLFSESEDPSGFFSKYSISESDVASVYGQAVLSTTNPYEILYDEGLYKAISQSTIISRYRMIIKINNDTGVEKLKRFPVPGIPVSAKTIKQNRQISEDVTFGNGTITFNSLKSGDIIDLQYKLTERTSHRIQGFGSSWLFGEESVINRKSVLVFYLPDGIDAHFSVRGNIKQSETAYNEGSVYVFQSENLFIPSFEDFMPLDKQQFVPGVEYSLLGSWNDFANWQIRFIKQSSVVNNDMLSISEKIKTSGFSKMKIIEILRDFVAAKITYSLNAAGIYKVKPEPSDVVLKKMTGDDKDKALLLKLMLNYTGIKAEYALAKSKGAGNLNMEIPSMQFDHAIVYIPNQDGIDQDFFVDPSSEYDSFPGIGELYNGTKAFVLHENDKTTYDFKIVHSMVNSHSEIIINPDDISSLKYKGADASIVRYLIKKNRNVDQVTEYSLFYLSGEHPEIENAAVRESKETGELIIEFKSGAIIPRPANALFGELVKADSRNYPVDLSAVPEHLSISVLSGVAADGTTIEEDNNYFKYTSEKYGEDGIKIVLEIKKSLVPPEEFAELKKSIISIMEFENRIPVK